MQVAQQQHRAPKARRRRQRVEKPVLSELPEIGLFRLEQFVPHLVGVGRSTWWKLVAAGKAPQPVKLSARVAVWRAEDLRSFIANAGSA